MNLWNANCDAKLPKTKLALLRDLEIWERTQGGMAPNMGPPSGPNAIMAKSFDAGAWSTSHGDDFRRLIEDARKKKDMQIRAKEPEVAAPEVTASGSWSQPHGANLSSSITQVQVSTAALPEAPIGLGNPMEIGSILASSETTAPTEIPAPTEAPAQTATNTAEVQNGGGGGVVLDASFAPYS